MVAPIEMRQELLKGLMDTDGYADARGHASYTTVSEKLAKQVQWIAWSLGYKANITSKIGKYTYKGERLTGRLSYTVWIKGDSHEDLFWLPRKRARAAAKFNGGDPRTRKIVSVEFSREAEAQCITVSHPNGLYLTDDFIVTHNSHLIVRAALHLSLAYPGNRGLIGRNEYVKLETTTLEEFDNVIPKQLISKVYNSPPVYRDIRLPEWPEGLASRVYFRGLENSDSFGSEQYGWVAADEASEVPVESRNMLLTRLRHPLPKKVKDIFRDMCWKCGGRTRQEWCPRGCEDEINGIRVSTIGNDIRRVFLAASNPYPGWFEDTFLLGEKDEVLEQRSDIGIHFVQSFIRDNAENLPPGYEAQQRALHANNPSFVDRMIDGKFGSIEGQVFGNFSPKLHEWRLDHHGELPKYTRVIGGLDFGGEQATSHPSAGLVGVITETNRIIWVDEFRERGADIQERQMEWVAEMEKAWAKPIKKRIEWTADRTQMLGVKFMSKVFRVSPSASEKDAKDANIRTLARLLEPDGTGRPGMY